MEKISGTLVYVCIQKPVKALQKAGAPAKPDEWKASVVVTDEDIADEFEALGKKWDTMVSCKKVKAAEFESIYKTPVPEGAGKNVWVITLRKSTQLGKTGKEVPEKYRPRVFEKVGNQTLEITNEKLVGNGSKGTISFEVFERSNGGGTLLLKNVLVTDLIEYESQEDDYTPGSEFDDSPEEPEQKPADKPKSVPTKPAKPKSDLADMDDDVPF